MDDLNNIFILLAPEGRTIEDGISVFHKGRELFESIRSLWYKKYIFLESIRIYSKSSVVPYGLPFRLPRGIFTLPF